MLRCMCVSERARALGDIGAPTTRGPPPPTHNRLESAQCHASHKTAPAVSQLPPKDRRAYSSPLLGIASALKAQTACSGSVGSPQRDSVRLEVRIADISTQRLLAKSFSSRSKSSTATAPNAAADAAVER